MFLVYLLGAGWQGEEAKEAYQRVQQLLGLWVVWRGEAQTEMEALRSKLAKAQGDAEAAEWAVNVLGRNLEVSKEVSRKPVPRRVFVVEDASNFAQSDRSVPCRMPTCCSKQRLHIQLGQTGPISLEGAC